MVTVEKRTLSELMQNLNERFTSAIFQTDEKTRLRAVFLSAAVDILSADPENKVLFFTPEDPRIDPPRDNALLQDLISTGRFRVVSYHDAHRELQNLLHSANTYGYHLQHLSIFAEDVDHCLPPEARLLLPEIMERGYGRSLRVFVSVMSGYFHSQHPLYRIIFLDQVIYYRLWGNYMPNIFRHKAICSRWWNNLIPDTDKPVTLLVPSDDVPDKVKQLLKAEKERKREEKRKNRKNTPPTFVQIILAVTAALLAFIASRLGG